MAVINVWSSYDEVNERSLFTPQKKLEIDNNMFVCIDKLNYEYTVCPSRSKIYILPTSPLLEQIDFSEEILQVSYPA